MSECECGRKRSKYANLCKKCDKDRRDARIEKAKEIVSDGKCPSCGNKIVVNSSLTGWFQCEQYGAEIYRAYSDRPACGFQIFTC